jgi:hypothetical protein
MEKLFGSKKKNRRRRLKNIDQKLLFFAKIASEKQFILASNLT